MSHGEGMKEGPEPPKIELVVKKRFCCSLRITSLMTAAMSGLVEIRNHRNMTVVYSINCALTEPPDKASI